MNMDANCCPQNQTCQNSGCCTSRLNVRAFALACGVTWGLGTLILGLIAFFSGYGMMAVTNLGSVYVGFAPTLVGSVVGALWGFIDGMIGGLILGFVYNRFVKKHCCCCNKNNCPPNA